MSIINRPSPSDQETHSLQRRELLATAATLGLAPGLLSAPVLGAETGDGDAPERTHLPGGAVTQQAPSEQGGPLGTNSRIADLLNHPAFAGFSRLLLPWDERSYDAQMRLRHIGELLPYHSHVLPEVVVSGLNRMIDDVKQGKTVFFDIYG